MKIKSACADFIFMPKYQVEPELKVVNFLIIVYAVKFIAQIAKGINKEEN